MAGLVGVPAALLQELRAIHTLVIWKDVERRRKGIDRERVDSWADSDLVLLRKPRKDARFL